MATKVGKLRQLFEALRAEAPHIATGRRGEEIAARALRRQGYVILERGFRCRLGEIDIVARDQEVLAVVEVKARTGEWVRSPADAVGPRKQRKLVLLARAYLALPRNRRFADTPVRFDVVGVTFGGRGAPRVEILRAAFDASSFDNSRYA